MKKLVAIMAMTILGVCFAAVGDCAGLTPVRDIGSTIAAKRLHVTTIISTDPCVQVENKLAQLNTCPHGQNCVNMDMELGYHNQEGRRDCELFVKPTILSDDSLRGASFVGVDGETSKILATAITFSKEDKTYSGFYYVVKDLGVFASYDHFAVRYQTSLSLRRIVFHTITVRSSTSGSGTDTDEDTGGDLDSDLDSDSGLGTDSDPETDATGSCLTDTDCTDGKVCGTETHTCVDAPPPQDLCGSITCTGANEVCVNGACTVQTALNREGDDEDLNSSRLESQFDMSEGGCQLSPHAASSASGAPYLWLTIAGIALAIARKRLN